MPDSHEAVAGIGLEIGNQIIYDCLPPISNQREVSVSFLKPWFGFGNMFEKPFAMREGDHEIQITLPDGHRYGDLGRFETPF
tara:strand:+ start:991 stop:1236 length:246 start_codon:yes stop_codon:yes gene_type:complete